MQKSKVYEAKNFDCLLDKTKNVLDGLLMPLDLDSKAVATWIASGVRNPWRARSLPAVVGKTQGSGVYF